MNMDNFSDQEVLFELGERLAKTRLNQNLSQQALSNASGISPRTIRNAESGKDITLKSLISILRALAKLDHLDLILPDPGISPIALAKLEGRKRKRAGNPKKEKNTGSWKWGDE